MDNQFSKRLKRAVSDFKAVIHTTDIERLISTSMEVRSLLSLTKNLSIIHEDEDYTQAEHSEILEQINLFAVLVTELKNKINITQLETELGIKIFLNSILPIDWNIYSDCLIIDSEIKNAPQLAEQAFHLGQKKIYGNFSGQSVKKVKKNYKNDINEIINNRAQQSLYIYDDENYSQDLHHFYTKLRDQLADNQMYERTLEKLSHKYLSRMIKNIDIFLLGEPVQNLKSIFQDENIIIISPGPSLAENIDDLQKYKDHYILVATAQACPLLTLNGIIPDYIIVVDALDYSISLKNVNTKEVKGLIVSTQVHRSFLEQDFQKIYFWESSNSIYGLNQFLKLNNINFGGGSVSVNALSLAINCKAKSITIIGQDLVIEKNSKYAEGISYEQTGDLIPRKDLEEINGVKFLSYGDGLLVRLFEVECIDRKFRLSPQDYYMYLSQIEKLIENCKIQLINASKRGAIINGFIPGKLEILDKKVPSNIDAFPSICVKSYRKFLSERQRKLQRLKKILNPLVSEIQNLNFDLVLISKYEKKLQSLLTFIPEINNLVASKVKKIESLMLNTIDSNIESNMKFSLILYQEVLSQVDEFYKINKKLAQNVDKQLKVL